MQPAVKHDEIKRRAAELWQQHGSPSGYEEEFWLQAERELNGEEAGTKVSANAPAATSGSGSDGPR
jgi:Protein of unknown function (DUF2934)